MHAGFKNHFIPHAGNNYHPHLLHTKRAIFYSAFFLALKCIIFITVLAIPSQAYLAPDVLAVHYSAILDRTNQLRAENGLPALSPANLLTVSANAKAEDMARNHYFSHFGPSRHTLSYFLDKAGYRYSVAGENLAMGFASGEEVINAWVKSPTHYANLIDTDFNEFGLGIEAGEYSGIPTVFVAEHFGAPLPRAPQLPGAVSEVERPTPRQVRPPVAAEAVPVPTQKVSGQKVAEAPEGLVYPILDKEHSHVFWAGDGQTTHLTIRARITGPVLGASVAVGQYSIPLTSDPQSDEWQAQLTVPAGPESFFKPIIVPTIIMKTPQGEEISDTIDWYNVKVLTPSPVEQYFNAKTFLPSLAGLFGTTRAIYLAFLGLFGLVLLLNIVIEVRRQHPHIIVQTLALLGLLICLVKI